MPTRRSTGDRPAALLPLWTGAARVTAACVALAACSAPTKSTTPHAARPSSRSGPRATAGTPGSTTPAPAVPSAPPPATEREIRGYFRNVDRQEILKVRTGPNDTAGWEWMTKLQAEIEGQSVYSMAVSAVRMAGVCRSPGKGLDQVLLSFDRKPPRENGAAVLWYDATREKFALEFIDKEIMRDPQTHFGCPGGRSLLPEGAPAVPCLCPWNDSPAGSSRPATSNPGALAAAGGRPEPGAREVLISPERTP